MIIEKNENIIWFRGVNYELVDENAETSTGFIYWSVLKNYLHANFKAKKKADDGSGESNPIIKLFFAETTFKKDMYGMDVLNCCIIDESDATKFTRGCIYCGEGILHPLAEEYSYGNTVVLNGRLVTIDFNKTSLEELVENERSLDLHGCTAIDGLSECGKLSSET